MARINLVLDDERTEQLEHLEHRERKSKTQLIKDGLDLLFKLKANSEHEDLSEFFGVLGDHGVDGLEYQRKIREEWDS